MNHLVFIAMFMCVLQQSLCDFKLTVLHTNDMHSRFEDSDAAAYHCKNGCFGGFARLKTAVNCAREEAKEKGSESIFLNAGDTFQGSIFFNRFGWKVVVPMLQTLGLDVISLGNHEFDGTTEMLAEFLAEINIPVVCSNIDLSEEEVFKKKNHDILTPSKVLEVGPDRVKVGIIGYLTYNETDNLGKVKLFPEIDPITNEVERLKKQGVNILIALGHSGYHIDKEIARLVPDIDLVVGGHTDTFLNNGFRPDAEVPVDKYPTVVEGVGGRKVLVVQAYAYTKYLGKLELTFDNNGEIIHNKTSGNPIIVDDDIYPQDPNVVEILRPFWDILKSEHVTRVVGRTKVYLEGDQICRQRECTLGNLVTDALVYAGANAYKGPVWTDSPIALITGGGLKADIDTGKYGSDEITFMQLASALTRTNQLVRLIVKGETLLQALEVSVLDLDNPREPSRQFLQYSGIRVLYDRTKPPGKRVVQAEARCGVCVVPKFKEINPEQSYNLITTKYLADGRDGFTMFNNHFDKQILSGLNERFAVEDYLTRMSPVYPTIEGRIRFVNEKSDGPRSPPTPPSKAITSRMKMKTTDLFRFFIDRQKLGTEKIINNMKKEKNRQNIEKLQEIPTEIRDVPIHGSR